MLHIHSCVSSVMPNCTTDFLWETCRRISVVVSASPGRGWQLLLLDDESRRERPTGARASAAAAPLAARPRARPAADVAVGPTAAEALLPAGAAARGATGPRAHLDAAGSPSPRFAIATPASIRSPADAITMGATIFTEEPIQESPELLYLLLPCRMHLPVAGKEWKKRFGWVCVARRLSQSVVFVDGVRRFIGIFRGL